MIPSFTTLGAIPGAETAVNWIKAQVGAFYQIPLRLTKAQDAAIKLQKVAGDKGNKTQQVRAYGISTALSSLKDSFNTTEVKLSALLGDMKAAGLGDIPFGLALSAIPLSASMLYLFKTVDYNEAALEDIKKKILSPDERTSLFGGGSISYGSIIIGVVGVSLAGYFFYKGMRR